ncbi:universal stress protein [Candidatus Sulfurimonas baltica]|uniref:Universal stress protein n=1 Tax=Candidatus Sulfurimonas baltica TaxID=2740404 RepID=A0A7S7LXD7_9BACT|nr:universal stress protein [Candidatus Sulfurimonas baltica]QOY53177.1 universal stress protein [Candidatus Sulfurimonas baltica]
MKEVCNILVAIDKSNMSQEALKRAISIAKEKDAQLYIIHIIESSFLAPVFVSSIDEDTLRSSITQQIETLNEEAKVDFILFIESGTPASLIGYKAKKIKADLLVVGINDKTDIRNEHFGSTALKLIQKTNIPVLIVKNEVVGNYNKMIFPTNLSDYSKESILLANTLFSKTSKKYISACESLYELETLEERISVQEKKSYKIELFKSAKIKLDEFLGDVEDGEIELIACDTSANEDLLENIEKDDSDLLVLGSKGVNNLNSFIFGSTATYLLQRSSIDTLIYVPIKSKKSSSNIEEKDKSSAIEQDLQSRRDEIRSDFESLFEEHLKIANWNIPEAEDQKIAEGLSLILDEKLDEIKQKIKEGRYQEKRTDFWV